MKELIKRIIGRKTIKFIKYIKFRVLRLTQIEPKEIIREREKFYSQFVHKNDLVFDVGANMGNRIQPLLNIGAKVIAIEPQKKCYESLKERFGKRITLIPLGVGEKEELKDFYISNLHTISSFSSPWIESVKEERFKSYTWEAPVKINITTLDRLIEAHGIPKFIKIDVEGYELEVLKGLTYPIDIISFEYTVPEQLHLVKDCIIQIEKYNPQIECNYSIGENMDFVFKDWKTTIDFKKFLTSQEFSKPGFGDIYVKTKR